MEVYHIFIEDALGEREVGPQFSTEVNAKKYVEQLLKQYPTKSIWVEKVFSHPRPSIPLNTINPK